MVSSRVPGWRIWAGPPAQWAADPGGQQVLHDSEGNNDRSSVSQVGFWGGGGGGHAWSSG